MTMAGERKTILLVEDEALIAAAESQLLTDRGFNVLTARNGETALTMFLARDHGVDLVLMDVDLGKGMDGPSTARELLKTADIPVVFISSHTEREIVERTRSVTSYGYVVKSAGDAVLLASLDTAFKLHEARHELRQLADNVSDVIVGFDLDFRFTYVSPSIERVAGYTSAEVLTMKPEDVFFDPSGNAITRFRDALLEAHRQHQPDPGLTAEVGLRRKDGQIVITELTLNLRRGPGGEPVEIVGVGRDITDRKTMERALREREQRYRHLTENSYDLICELDRDGIFRFVNSSYVQVLGFTPEDLIGLSAMSLIHLEDREKSQRALFRAFEEGSARSEPFRFRDATGNYRWFEAVGRSFLTEEGASRIVINSREITEAQDAMELLSATVQSYRELINTIDDAIYILDEQGVFSDVNDGALKMYGHPREIFIGKTPAFLSAPGRNDLEAAGRAIMAAYHGEPQRLDWWGLRANGEIFPKDVRMNRGTYLGRDVVIAVGRDMSDRKKVEEKLAESNRQYQTLVEGMNEGLLQVDNDDVIIYANRQFCDLTGYTREELVGKIGFDLLFRREDGEIIRHKNSVRKRGLSDAYQLPLQRKDGNVLWVRISGSPVYDAAGNVIGSIGIHTDMTQQKKSDEELQRAVRDREVLMKELQHRVKNNLVIISSLLGFEVPRLRDEYSRQILLDAQARIRSMSIIYEQLQYAEKTGSVRLDRYIDDLGRALIGTYEMERGKVRIVAQVDPIELDQKRTIPVGLILNELITNALKYAYPAGKEGEILVRLVARDGKVVFSVSDTGVGLPGGVDPATSESMGMSLIRLLAEQLGGRVDFRSGAGMNITVTFPAVVH
jgi:PAS domain S-box-containing protein